MEYNKPQMDLDRPLSWSAIYSFRYNEEQWYRKYVLHQEELPSRAMLYGNVVGERLASDPTYLPEVPRAQIFEYELRSRLEHIPLIGFIDSYTPHTTLHEYKTGAPPWTQARADQHQQLDGYLLMLYLNEKVHPKDVDTNLHWLPTQENGDFSVSLKTPVTVHSFYSPRTLTQILYFAKEIKDIYAQMQEYAKHN
jgi:hypothetical protein